SISHASVLDESAMTEEHPFGKNMTEVLEHFLACAEKLGFRTKNIRNKSGYAEIGTGDKLVGVLAHLDVVPEGEHAAWIVHPFSAEIVDGKVYGRGTVDDKGPAYASLYAAKALAEAAELNCRVRIIVGIDEESGSRCIKDYLTTEEVPECSFSPDASFPLINAEKGIMRAALSREFGKTESPVRLLSMSAGTRFNVVPDKAEAVFDGLLNTDAIHTLLSFEGINVSSDSVMTFVKAKGVSAHAMNPEFGVNAAVRLAEAIGSIDWGESEISSYLGEFAKAASDTRGSGLGIECADDVSGPLTCNAGIMKYENNVLDFSFDIRYPVTLSQDGVYEKLAASAKKLGAVCELLGGAKPLFVEPDTPLIKKLLEAYRRITGEEAVPRSTGGGTYCRNLSNSVSFGPNFPGTVDLDHQPNEFISLDDLRK
ncbi:MAG: Sapep family Mn(2+)-dependent dipeptidase, partial [Synergistaceae bacterium]